MKIRVLNNFNHGCIHINLFYFSQKHVYLSIYKCIEGMLFSSNALRFDTRKIVSLIVK